MSTSARTIGRLHALLVATLCLAATWACSPQAPAPVATPVAAMAEQPAGSAKPAAPSGPTRMERDLLGEKAVPANAYYGVQTARALENFQISGIPISHYPGFVEAWAIVKLAAARGNTDVGAMNKEVLGAIEKAAEAIMQGKYHDQFQETGPGRGRHLDQHERQRGDGQHCARADRAPEGRLQDRRAAR